MHKRFALYLQDKHNIQYELEMVRYAEERGFSEIWQADTRLARDCIVMMSAFLAAVSHELRTPLNSILGFSEIMRDGRVGAVSAQHKEYLNDIWESGSHLLRRR